MKKIFIIINKNIFPCNLLVLIKSSIGSRSAWCNISLGFLTQVSVKIHYVRDQSDKNLGSVHDQPV